MKKKLKKIIQFIANPRLLLCVAVAWMITNGWSYVMFAVGTYFGIAWMVAVAGAYLTFLWLPVSPEKIVTFTIAIALLRWWFPNDTKTLAVLKNFYENAKKAFKQVYSKYKKKLSEYKKKIFNEERLRKATLMKEKLKGIKFDITFSAVLTVVLGVIFLIWPGTILTSLAKIIAIILIIGGIGVLLYQIFSSTKNAIFMILSAIVALIGFWMLMRPTSVVSVIPIVIGVVLIAHGIQDIVMALEGRQNKASRWGMMILAAVLSIVLGIVCIASAFQLVSFATRIIGAMLIYDGLSDMLIVYKVNKSGNVIDGEIKQEKDVDDVDDFN